MRKCTRCGRRGFFLKLQDGLCQNCVAIISTEAEIARLKEEQAKATNELERVSAALADKAGTFKQLSDAAAHDGCERARREMAEQLRESELRLKENEEGAAAADAKKIEAQVAEIKALKSAESTNKKILQFKSLLSALQNSANMSSGEYPITPSEISNLLARLDDLLSPTAKLELQCLGMRELRKRYHANEKCIQAVLDKYKNRYTTKANATIYALTVIALKSELQNILFSLKFGSIDKASDQLKQIMQKYYLIASDGNQSIAPTMRKFIGELGYLFDEAIHIEYEYYVQKERAREEQRAIREQMRQEAEERKALEAERKKVEREEAKYTDQISQVQEQIHATEDLERIAQLEARLRELQKQKSQVEEKKAQIITLQNGKAGNVYVISNLGAFGEEVFKIGMTRRADPQERIDELGNASVPFPFDVHSFIFSNDAVSLESRIHKILNEKRVNKVNLRKEFFKVSLDELESLVLELEPSAEFKRTMVAEQFRQSQSISIVAENPVEFDDDEEEAS